jgi:CheY-like chemotaxis protein
MSNGLRNDELANAQILIVEDDPDLLLLIKYHLAELGCCVRDAITGETAIRKAFAQPPDIVIVDMLLPGLDGLEVIRTLRADPRTQHCRFIIFSVLLKEELLGVGADAVLSKPFRHEDVKNAVETALAAARGNG